jgi:thiol:disulfide interchange protein DsbD
VTNAPAHVVVVGSKSDPAAKKLYEAALTQLPMNARMAWWDKSEGPLLNADTDYPDTGHATAYICHGIQCSLPITDTDQLIQQLDAIMVNHAVPEAVAKANSSKNVIDLSDIISDSMNAEKVLADKHFILVILGFLGFGLLLSFTPCLLPLVPIMASIIVGNTIGVKKQKTFLLCLTYVVAMSFSYAILGMIAGAFGVYLQSYMQSTKMIVIFSLLFFLLALAMLDAYELSIPRVIQQKLNDWSNLQEGGRYLGVAIMGMLSSLIVSPCVSAPLVGVLGFITKTGNYTLGAIGLFFMGFGMGVPLLIITLFSTNILPRASKWNAQIKTFFGIILLGASVWMISRILSDALTMLLWAAFIIFTSIYMGITKRRVTSLFAKFWKLITIMLFVYGVALFYEALFISSDLYELLSQHRVAATQEALFKPVVSLSELEADLKTAAALRQPVILDFSAKWCTACMSLEHTVFKDEMVKSQLTKFMVLRVDLTTMTPESEALTKQFNIAGPPMMVFFNDHGKPVDVRAIGDMDVKSFSALLQTELSAAQ